MNKRTLKKSIDAVCEALFAEIVASTLYGHKNIEDGNDLVASLVRLRNDYFSRISHPEPGISAKAYFADLLEKFDVQVSEIEDQINA